MIPHSAHQSQRHAQAPPPRHNATYVGARGGAGASLAAGTPEGDCTGDAADLCLEPAQAHTQTSWAYVGPGKGGYHKIQDYRYVGDGGSYTQQVQTTYGRWHPRKACVAFVGAVALAGAFYLAMLYSAGPPSGGPRARRDQVLVNAPPPVQRVSPAVILTTTLEPPMPTPFLHNCEDGFYNWQKNWDHNKRSWCCQRFGRACPVRTTLEPYNCKAGYSTFETTWSAAQKEWCCNHYFPLGCPRTSTAAPHDCKAGIQNWSKKWTIAKKAWCCEHEYVGCPTTGSPKDEPQAKMVNTTPQVAERYCQAGRPKLWPSAKKAWCCAKHKIGCPTAASSTSGAAALRDCSAGHGCAETHPPATTVSQPFDCDFGYPTWQNSWTAHKRAWCCGHMRRGCTPTTTALHYDCGAEHPGSVQRWPLRKREWCCVHRHLGCPAKPAA